MTHSLSDAIGRILSVLDRMEIPYLVGGSVASSIHGQSRPTMDLDLVADLRPEHVDEFVQTLAGEFYVDAQSIRDAMRLGRAFNIIHLGSTFKIDIFPLKRDEYSQVSFQRRGFRESHSFGLPVELAVASPEDTVLRKLEWYRSGGEISERQWNDLRGVVRMRTEALDYEYLRKWAVFLKVDDLLERLLAEQAR